MPCRAYRIRLRLLGPLHVGAGQAGNIQRTRPYVTGRAFWGALTARVTRDRYPHSDDQDYERVGREIHHQLAFSYFYLVGEKDEAVQVWPWGETADEFAWRYLGSYASTALEHGAGGALAGSLHEVEFIAPTTRDGDRVHLLGYVFEQPEAAQSWREALGRLQLGGERGYGWGRVSPLGSPEPVDGQPIFEHYRLMGEVWPPVLEAQSTEHRRVPLLAHTLAAAEDGRGVLAQAEGAVEPLVGRETTASGAFRAGPSEARICWAPGATVGAGTRITIAHCGIWHAVH